MFSQLRFSLALLSVGAVLTATVVWTNRQRAPRPETVKVERRDFNEEVAVSGRVIPRREVTVGFETPGTITRLNVTVGAPVRVGTLLATIDARSATLEVEKARATLAAARVEASDAVAAADQRETNTRRTQVVLLARLSQDVRDKKQELDAQESLRQREIAESGDDSVKARAAFLNLARVTTAYHAAQHALRVGTAEAQEARDTARASSLAAQARLAATEQSARGAPERSSLAASVALAVTNLEKTALSSPIDGVVTAVRAEAGESVVPGAGIVTVQSLSDLQIETFIPEVDASKVEVGQTGEATFDALSPDTRLMLHVREVEPAATIVEGLPTFRTLLAFQAPGTGIRSGMTANVRIRTAERTAALVIPQRAVITKAGRLFVRVLFQDGRTEERPIKTGLRNPEGLVEITSGLREHEDVVTNLLEPARRRSLLPFHRPVSDERTQ